MATESFTVNIAGTTYRAEPRTVDETWFNDGVDNGTAPSNANQWLEFAEAEIGQDNQFAEYDGFMVGQPADDARKPGRTVEWHVADDASQTQDTAEKNQQFKMINRQRSARDGPEMVTFGPHRKLNQTTPSEQVGIGRVFQPAARKGTIVALHSNDPNNNDGVSRLYSDIEIHGYGLVALN